MLESEVAGLSDLVGSEANRFIISVWLKLCDFSIVLKFCVRSDYTRKSEHNVLADSHVTLFHVVFSKPHKRLATDEIHNRQMLLVAQVMKNFYISFLKWHNIKCYRHRSCPTALIKPLTGRQQRAKTHPFFLDSR